MALFDSSDMAPSSTASPARRVKAARPGGQRTARRVLGAAPGVVTSEVPIAAPDPLTRDPGSRASRLRGHELRVYEGVRTGQSPGPSTASAAGHHIDYRPP